MPSETCREDGKKHVIGNSGGGMAAIRIAMKVICAKIPA
jgi:hypothetical protein